MPFDIFDSVAAAAATARTKYPFSCSDSRSHCDVKCHNKAYPENSESISLSSAIWSLA
jgi:hypothetical protein